MIHKFKKGPRSFTLAVFLVCLIFSIFTLNAEAQIPFYNPFLSNPLFNPIPYPFGYSGSPIIPPSQSVYSQGISYTDYYAPYPYLQQQDSSYSAGSETTSYVNGPGTYVANNAGYIPGYPLPLNVPNPYQTYQSAQPANYSSSSTNTYQTVSFYPNTNNTNTQTYQPNTGTYNQSYIPAQTYSGNYIPAVQNGYYAPTVPQTPNVYTPFPSPVPNLPQPSIYPQPGIYPQPQPNTYYPANPYTQNQYPANQYSPTQPPYSGYYVPNANYWPNVEIAEPEPPADIGGEYRGYWKSDTTGDDGEICGGIDQDDTQVSGETKLKEYVIGVEGKTGFTGTVNGNTVTLEIDLDGPVLEFVGTVQSNGDITGTYTVEGSSGSVIDEGTLTLEPK